MRLLSLKAENLFSLGDVTLPLDKQGLVLVTGYSKDEGSSNGAGKSSVANKAIVWTLFGQTAGGLRADDVINRHGGKAVTRGVVKFEGVDGKEYMVYRTRNPNNLELVEGTTRLSRRNERDTQELINQALGRDVTTFLQADFFGQGRPKSYPALAPKEQKEVLEQILPISKLTVCWEAARAEKKALDDRILPLEHALSAAQGKAGAIHLQTSNVCTLQMNWDHSRLVKITKLQEGAEHNEALVKEIKDRQDVIQEGLAGLGEIDITCNKQLAEATRVKGLWKNKMDTTNARIIPGDSSICPMCEQQLPDSLPEAQGKLLVELNIASTSYITARKAEEFWYDQARRLQLRSDLRSEMEKLEYQVGEISSAPTNTQLRIQSQETNPYTQQFEDLRVAGDGAALEVEQIKKKIAQLQSESDILTFWADAFSKDLRNYMLAKACPFLEAKANAHLQGLGNPQLKVKFSTVRLLKSGDTKEDFNVKVESDTGGMGYASLSGGEQQMVSFAVGLALSDLAESQVEGASHFLILDEPFTMLDGRNSENLVQYLTNIIGQRRETILLISNVDTLKSLIPSRVHVVKDNGISQLEAPHA